MFTALRGERGHHASLQGPHDHRPAPRRAVRYGCPWGHVFEVPFCAAAEIPHVWVCRLHGTESTVLDGAAPEQTKANPARTHWDMLLERRSVPELEELLNERLDARQAARKATQFDCPAEDS